MLKDEIQKFLQNTYGVTEKVEDLNELQQIEKKAQERLDIVMTALSSIGVPPQSVQVDHLENEGTRLIFGFEGAAEKAKLKLLIQPVEPYLIFISTDYPEPKEITAVALYNNVAVGIRDIATQYFAYHWIEAQPVIHSVSSEIEDSSTKIVDPGTKNEDPVTTVKNDAAEIENADVEIIKLDNLDDPLEEVQQLEAEVDKLKGLAAESLEPVVDSTAELPKPQPPATTTSKKK
jgi:hypothetical protein